MDRPTWVVHPSGDQFQLYTDNLYRRSPDDRRPMSHGALMDDIDRWESRQAWDERT